MSKYNSPENMEINRDMVAQLFSTDEGVSKKASAKFENWFRTYERDCGLARRVSPPTAVTEADFERGLDTRAPQIIRDMMPRSAGAISVNFDTGTTNNYMHADRYAIYLNRSWTPNYQIAKEYLVSYRGDLVAVFHDLMLQDLLQVEDVDFITALNVVLGIKGVVNPDIGTRQFIELGPTIDTSNIAYALSGMTLSNSGLSPSQVLVHRSFWFRLCATFRADHQGQNITEAVLTGDTSVVEEKLWGVTWRSALETKLIAPDRMYILAAPEFVGDFVTYGDTQVFSKVTANIWLDMYAHNSKGIAIPNTAAVYAVDWKGTAGTWFDAGSEPWN